MRLEAELIQEIVVGAYSVYDRRGEWVLQRQGRPLLETILDAKQTRKLRKAGEEVAVYPCAESRWAAISKL